MVTKEDTLNFFHRSILLLSLYTSKAITISRLKSGPLIHKIHFFAPCDHNTAFMPILINKRIIRRA